MKEHAQNRRATVRFAKVRGWDFTASAREHRTFLDELRGEPFHEDGQNSTPYVAYGECRHRLSDLMRGTHCGRSAVVFAYTREQEILDDSFGRRGREISHYWVAALTDLPSPVPRLQVSPRTARPSAQPGIVIGDQRVNERFHVHADDPAWAVGVLSDLASILVRSSGRAWRASGTAILTWQWLQGPLPSIPLDQVDAALDELSVITERLIRVTGRPES